MQRILLFISIFCIIACANNKNREEENIVDYYSLVKLRLKEHIIQTKAEKNISIHLPEGFEAYQGFHDLQSKERIDELWYKSNLGNCGIHIMISKDDEYLNGEYIIQRGVDGVKVDLQGAVAYSKRLTNNKDTIYYLNAIGRVQDDEEDVSYFNQICYIIKNDTTYTIGIFASNSGHKIDFELYNEIANTIRIVDK